MNINYNNSVFPSQVVSDAEKSSIEYTLEPSEILPSNFSDSFEEQAQKIVIIIKTTKKFLINS